MEPILQVKNLTHTYSAGTPFQRSAIENVSFSVQPGEFLGIIGHTGSGKSTLIQHLNGLLKPTSGQVLLAGRDIWAEPKKIRQVRFRVGLVFQYPEYQLFEETVYKDIAFGPQNMGKTGKELDRCVREAARLAGVRDEHLEKSPFELSGGQKRRAALAGVLAMDPEVLVLDEPTAGLDPAGRENLMENIRNYHRNKGRTILLVSHSMEEIARNADRILVLKDAHVLMEGPPREVFGRAEELLSAGLDVPQVTRAAMALKARGLAIDPAVYTVEALERQLADLWRAKRGTAGKAASDLEKPGLKTADLQNGKLQNAGLQNGYGAGRDEGGASC
ncbi:MAG: energy-coupling factor transporter ATPase [Oscillibacter sp.]|nr:energy-coupling factor transporter ATPase [Oscillibacter sp.]